MVILVHPTLPDFHAVHHPAYVDFYDRVLPTPRDPLMEKRYEEGATPTPSTATCTAPATPTTACTPSTCGTGATRDAPLRARHHRRRRPGGRAPARLRPASTLDDALEVASDVVGRCTDDHPHPQPPDPDGRREVSERSGLTAGRASASEPDGDGVRGRSPPRREVDKQEHRITLRHTSRAAGRVEHAVDRATAPSRNIGFPYRAPTVQRGVDVPEEPPSLGADYDTDWARSPAARVRTAACSPKGKFAPSATSRRPDLRHRSARQLRRRAADSDEPPPPLIFAPDHSHLDTALMVRARALHVAQAPRRGRRRRLLLRQAVESDARRAVAQRHPHRPPVGPAGGRQTWSGRPRRRRLEPGDLPGRRTLPNRSGQDFRGWRRLVMVIVVYWFSSCCLAAGAPVADFQACSRTSSRPPRRRSSTPLHGALRERLVEAGQVAPGA